ncbi:hypothetical protein G9A89_005386 [Geosiphon pyriformis]|nr:hypothetical protein G9A89_005386 [Geosiphon pyriformis]
MSFTNIPFFYEAPVFNISFTQQPNLDVYSFQNNISTSNIAVVTSNKTTEIDPYNPPFVNGNNDFYIVLAVACVGMAMNTLGCIFLLTSVFIKWKSNKWGVLAMAYRLPLYTALTGRKCSTRNKDPVATLVSLTTSSLTKIVTLFCFVSILITLSRHRKAPVNSQETHRDYTVEDRITRKITSFLLVFLLQWVPVTIYVIGAILKKTGTWSYVTVLIGLNFGCIGNSIAFILNERMRGPKKRPADEPAKIEAAAVSGGSTGLMAFSSFGGSNEVSSMSVEHHRYAQSPFRDDRDALETLEKPHTSIGVLDHGLIPIKVRD